jgi:hypothetical protein
VITINWATRVIYVPKSFLTALGGPMYQLNIETFRNALKDIEDDEAGIVHPNTHNRNAPVLLSGVTYAQTFEVTNGYTVTFENTGVPYTVSCIGANHNLGDVTNFNGGMSLIIGNSAGAQVLAVGSGVTAQDKVDIINGVHATPIDSNLVSVAGTEVRGTGTQVDPWGPA